MKKQLKILEICPFSAGVCGVWTRVLSESLEFKKLGNSVEDIQIFSSNLIKGTHEYAESSEKIKGINVKRFKSRSIILSSNVHIFEFKKELEEFNPDIVITHLLHPHSFQALEVCKKLDIPCYLVTHAPFNIKRRFPLNLATKVYNYFKIRPIINNFERIIAITQWEVPYLEKLGVKKEKIIYIPNGIPQEFFSQKKARSNKDVLFLGRIAPVKHLETLVRAAKLLPEINFSIVGSAEKIYLNFLNDLIRSNDIKNIKIMPPVYDLFKKIKIIDEHKIFVLPSLREAMPQVLLEAMARGKIVIASETDGAKEIIINKTGFLFKIGDYKKLARLIKLNLQGDSVVQSLALNNSKKYSWQKLIKLYPFIR
jgi:glycosyltransferase involved in cell wall biosynthesis